MRTEVPVFRRCCFCLPLRYGLLIWSYLILLPNILRMLIDLYQWHYIVWYYQFYTWLELTRFVLSILNQLFNFGLTILLIVASHKKDTKLFKIFYFYAIIFAVATFILVVSDFVFDMIMYHFRVWKYLFSQAMIGVIYVCLLFYIIALVRSEIMKLENSCKFEFTNIAVEANGDYYDKENSLRCEENSHTDRHTNTEHSVKIVLSTDNNVNNGLSKQ